MTCPDVAAASVEKELVVQVPGLDRRRQRRVDQLQVGLPARCKPADVFQAERLGAAFRREPPHDVGRHHARVLPVRLVDQERAAHDLEHVRDVPVRTKTDGHAGVQQVRDRRNAAADLAVGERHVRVTRTPRRARISISTGVDLHALRGLHRGPATPKAIVVLERPAAEMSQRVLRLVGPLGRVHVDGHAFRRCQFERLADEFRGTGEGRVIAH